MMTFIPRLKKPWGFLSYSIKNDSTLPEVSHQDNVEDKKENQDTEKILPSLSSQKTRPTTQSPKYQLNSGSLILDFTDFIASIPLRILDEICNGSENRQKAKDQERRINEKKNRELYPNPSPDIVFDYGKDYTNCQYGPWTKLSQELSYNALVNHYPLNVDMMNSCKEYEEVMTPSQSKGLSGPLAVPRTAGFSIFYFKL